MNFSWIKGESLGRSATATIWKGAQLALLLCGLLGIASVLSVSRATIAIPNATASKMIDPGVKLTGRRRQEWPGSPEARF